MPSAGAQLAQRAIVRYWPTGHTWPVLEARLFARLRKGEVATDMLSDFSH